MAQDNASRVPGVRSNYARAAGLVLLAALLGLTIRNSLAVIDAAMLLMLAVVIAALRYPPGPAIAAATFAIALFDFIFVPPYYTFDVGDARYVLTFAMMLVVAATVSRLATRIRDQARAALALVEAREAARAVVGAEQLRTALLSSLSHDLRTPLSTIQGAASAMLDDVTLPEESRKALTENILGESQRMARLVTNLLDMVRLETGKLAVTAEWQPLDESLGVALLRMESALGDRPVRVDVPSTLPLICADGLLLEQVFVNLLENAAKYTPPGTRIAIRAWAGDRDITVEVADAGAGIPAAEMDSVFAKFYRRRADAEMAGGSGLGLTICRGIIVAHGGRIWAERATIGGAAFRFTLPRRAGAPMLAAEQE